MTADVRTNDAFLYSDDGGRNWYSTFDTTVVWQNSFSPAYGLTRDFRGIVYWDRAAMRLSLDNGRTFTQLQAEYGAPFYVLPPDGLIVEHHILVGDHPEAVSMSFDHGRTFTKTLVGSDEFDSTRDFCCIFNVNDQIGIREYVSANREPWTTRTLYWSRALKSWVPGRYIDVGWHALVDSAGYWYGFGDGVTIQGPNDTIAKQLVKWLPSRTWPHTDTTILYEYEHMDAIYYDLEGAVHPTNSLIRLPIRKSRPVSLLDRLFTCTGVEYVLGGHRIDSVWLDNARSFNAKLTYTVTINRRLSTVLVTAINPAIRMYFSILVDDKVTGTQRFSDTVTTIASRPRISLNKTNAKSSLECTWPDGPFMWLRDSAPIPHPVNRSMNGESVVRDLKPGVYKVRGRTPFGCDVHSNEIVITATDVDSETLVATSGYQVRCDDMGMLQVRWSGAEQPKAINIYDVLGRLIDSEAFAGVNGTTILLPKGLKVFFVVVTGEASTYAFSVICQQ